MSKKIYYIIKGVSTENGKNIIRYVRGENYVNDIKEAKLFRSRKEAKKDISSRKTGTLMKEEVVKALVEITCTITEKK